MFDFDEQQEQREWNRRLHYALRRVKQAAEVDRVAAQLVAEGLISLQERPELLQRACAKWWIIRSSPPISART